MQQIRGKFPLISLNFRYNHSCKHINNAVLKQYILKGYAANEHRLEELRQTLQIIYFYIPKLIIFYLTEIHLFTVTAFFKPFSARVLLT